MNEKEAYKVVFYLYEELAHENRDSLIDIIHGSMQLLQDGSPADGSIKGDWQKALALSDATDNKNLDEQTVYKIASNLIDIFYESNLAKPQELKDLVNRMNNHDNKISEYWRKAFSRAKIDEESVKLKLD